MDAQDLIRLVKDTPGTFTIRVVGRSMFPILKQGDKIRFRKVPLSEVSAGSLILYQDGKHLFSHRLIHKIKGKKKLFFLEKGDNTTSFSWWSEDDYLGKIEEVERRGKVRNLEKFSQVLFGKVMFWWNLLLIILIKFKRSLSGDSFRRARRTGYEEKIRASS